MEKDQGSEWQPHGVLFNMIYHSWFCLVIFYAFGLTKSFFSFSPGFWQIRIVMYNKNKNETHNNDNNNHDKNNNTDDNNKKNNSNNSNKSNNSH